MAIITKQELRNLSVDEMKSKISELRIELIKQNAQVATGTTPKSPGKLREIKKTENLQHILEKLPLLMTTTQNKTRFDVCH